MRILVFTEGTIFIHERWVNLPREEIVKLVKSWSSLSKEELDKLKNSGTAPGLGDYAGSVPIGDCVKKIQMWKKQGATIIYLTSRTKPEEIQTIRELLRKYNFPEGELLFKKVGEEYKEVAERAFPDVIVEDDCESIGGESEMTYPRIKPEMKAKIKSIVVKEFGGIDHLPDDITELLRY
jgi:hypothetical protein